MAAISAAALATVCDKIILSRFVSGSSFPKSKYVSLSLSSSLISLLLTSVRASLRRWLLLRSFRGLSRRSSAPCSSAPHPCRNLGAASACGSFQDRNKTSRLPAACPAVYGGGLLCRGTQQALQGDSLAI